MSDQDQRDASAAWPDCTPEEAVEAVKAVRTSAPLLAWLRQRLMESGNRDAHSIVQVTIVYKRHDGTTATYARPVVEGTADA